MRRKTIEAAQGRWRAILGQLGKIDARTLDGKHHPCPSCQGRDRFRFDDKDGRGTYFCSGCGAGTGMDLLCKVTGWDFRTAAAEVDKIVDNLPKQRPGKQPIGDDRAHRLCAELWARSSKVRDGDPVARYLAGRGLPLPRVRGSLRYAERELAPDYCGGGWHPTMVALISAADGSHATLHRTYLGPNGKADLVDPRATMPGTIPDGAAIRLAIHGERLGIAEGIETALAASVRFNLPVWAAINSTMLSKWQPPEGVREVVIFADNDPGFGGQKAAYALAHRLACVNHLQVKVEVSPRVGTDWADILREEAAA